MMKITTVPATLFANGETIAVTTLRECLHQYDGLPVGLRERAEIVCDGAVEAGGGHLHWRMTRSDIERARVDWTVGIFD